MPPKGGRSSDNTPRATSATPRTSALEAPLLSTPRSPLLWSPDLSENPTTAPGPDRLGSAVPPDTADIPTPRSQNPVWPPKDPRSAWRTGSFPRSALSPSDTSPSLSAHRPAEDIPGPLRCNYGDDPPPQRPSNPTTVRPRSVARHRTTPPPNAFGNTRPSAPAGSPFSAGPPARRSALTSTASDPSPEVPLDAPAPLCTLPGTPEVLPRSVPSSLRHARFGAGVRSRSDSSCLPCGLRCKARSGRT